MRHPIQRVVRCNIFNNQFQFNVQLAHRTSTTIITLPNMSDKAKDYFANNSILIIGDHTPVALMFVFET